MTARETLDRALIDLAADGRRPRCGEHGDSSLWTSDSVDDRRRAAELCARCPVLRQCAEAAEEERDAWSTRGGVDRRRTRPKKENQP